MRDNARESDDVLRGSVQIFGAEVTVDRLFRVHRERWRCEIYMCVHNAPFAPGSRFLPRRFMVKSLSASVDRRVHARTDVLTL